MFIKKCDCGAEIVLLQVYPNGRWIPFEAKPIQIVVFGSEVARVATSDDPKERPRPQPPNEREWGRIYQAWQPHWANCPRAKAHRRERRA